jgi:N-dimethylarginine dimethylaminohydrolase
MVSGRLLDERQGKIKHIFLTYSSDTQYFRVLNTIKAFDEDVRFTVFYNSMLSTDTYLERIANETGNEVELINARGKLPEWVQDGTLVFDNQEIMLSVSNKTLSKRLRSFQSVSNLLNLPYWQENGFSVVDCEHTLPNLDGGDLITIGDTTYVGSYLSSEFIRNFGTKRDVSFKRAQQIVEQELRKLISLEKTKFIGIKQKPVAQHIDMYFTPLDDVCIIGDVKSSFGELELPINFGIDKQLRNMSKNLEALATKLAKRKEVIRIPCLPPIKIKDESGREGVIRIQCGHVAYETPNLIPFISYNNILVEKFQQDGEEVKRVYMPTYHIDQGAISSLTTPQTHQTLLQQQTRAQQIYEELGYEVRTVKLEGLIGADGGLRCSTKILKRSN